MCWFDKYTSKGRSTRTGHILLTFQAKVIDLSCNWLSETSNKFERPDRVSCP